MRRYARFGLVSVTLAASLARAEQPGFSAGVSAGDVGPDRVVLWTRPDEPGLLRLELSSRPEFDGTLISSFDLRAEATRDLTAHIRIDGLAPNSVYFYRFVRIDDARASRVGRFQTLPPHDESRPVRFLFSGDSNFRHAPFSVMSAAAKEPADFFIWFGDSIYADVSAGGLGPARTLDEYRAKYRQIRSDDGVRDLLATMPLVAGWDDHEVRNDYAGLDPELSIEQRHAGYQAFFEYMPIETQNAGGEPFRTYRSFRCGENVEFFLLDGRQYREPSALRECDGHLDPTGFLVGPLLDNEACTRALSEPRTMLGRAQFDWLASGLAASTARVKFVVNNVPLSFMGVFPYDRWDGYDAERRELLEFIDAHRIDGVVFLTTDIHANALNPDLGAYFRRHRPDYALSNGVRMPEIIVGPIGNETARQSLHGIAGEIVGNPDNPLASLVLAAIERDFESRLVLANRLDMIQTNRVSYAVINVSDAAEVSVFYRGAAPESANDATTPIETFHESMLTASRAPQPFTCGCGVPFALPIVLAALRGGRRKAIWR